MSPPNSSSPPPPPVQDSKPVSTKRVTSGRFSTSNDRGEASVFQAAYSSKTVASTCKFCGDCEHSSLKCTKVVSHNARVEMTKKKGLCFRCLSSGHGGRKACLGVEGRLGIESFLCKSRSHVTPLCKKAGT